MHKGADFIVNELNCNYLIRLFDLLNFKSIIGLSIFIFYRLNLELAVNGKPGVGKREYFFVYKIKDREELSSSKSANPVLNRLRG